MYVEPSAVIAILKEESGADVFRERIAVASSKVISVVGKVEAAIAMGRAMRNHDLAPELVDRFCDDANIATVPVYADIYNEVVMAYRRYGKGTGHPARLNFGDCFSYAYCKKYRMPLLFKGEDFSQTDIESAL